MTTNLDVEPDEGLARMAEARLIAYGPAALSELDVEALRRHPAPPGVAGLPRSRPPVDIDAILAGTTPAPERDAFVDDTVARLDRLAEDARTRRRADDVLPGRYAADEYDRDELGDPDHLAAGEAARDDAIERAAGNAAVAWKETARNAIRAIAATQPELTGDDLWRIVDKPAEPRAAGAIFRWAAAEGLIAATDRFVPTTQATSHASPSRVWRSLTYEEARLL